MYLNEKYDYNMNNILLYIRLQLKYKRLIFIQNMVFKRKKDVFIRFQM